MGDMRVSNDGSFIVGVAYNQRYGYDFGNQLRIQTNQGVSQGPTGLDDPDRAKQMISDFQKLAANGVNAVSIKVFADGRTGIDFDPKDPGRALKVQDSVYTGLDNVMKAAVANGLAVQLVLFDHLFAEKGESLVTPTKGLYQTGPEQKQGHVTAFSDPGNRALLLQNVIAPLLDHLGANPNLLSVELVNEPESILQSMHCNVKEGIPANQTAGFKEYMRMVRDLVHDSTGAQFSVGSLGVAYAKEWLDVIDPNQDYLSIHYYENKYNRDPRYDSLYGPNSGISKLQQAGVPVIFGEYAANGYGKVGAEEFLEGARAHGVQGGIAWAMYDPNGNLGEAPAKSGSANFGPLPLDDFRHFRLLNPDKTQRRSSPPERKGGFWKRLFDAVAEFDGGDAVPRAGDPARRPAGGAFGGGALPARQQFGQGRTNTTAAAQPKSKPANNFPNPWNRFNPTNPFGMGNPANPNSPLNPYNPMNINNPNNPASHEYRKRMERIRNAGNPSPHAGAFGPAHAGPAQGPGGAHGPAGLAHAGGHPFGPMGGTNHGGRSGPPTLVHGPTVHMPPHRQAWNQIHKPNPFGVGQNQMTIHLSDIHRNNPSNPAHRAIHHNQPTRVMPAGPGWKVGPYYC